MMELGIDADAAEIEPEDLVLTREPDGTLRADGFPSLIRISVAFLLVVNERKGRARHRYGCGWYVVERWEPGHEGRTLLARQVGYSPKPAPLFTLRVE